MSTHLAAVSPSKGQPFISQSRATPKAGPGELLIAVKSVALNPADGLIRDLGLFISDYPTVIGFDFSGLVLEVGEEVPTNAITGRGNFFNPGITRVAAYSASFWKSYDANYGAFQEKCLVPWQHAVPLPDDSISWKYAATLPVATEVALRAWETVGILKFGTDAGSENENKQCKEALLVWGASSSVGTMGVQSARLLKEDDKSPFAAVYATAGLANEDYVSSLGADRVFNHKEPDVVETIVAAAKKDGLLIRRCFLATGQLAPCQTVLTAFLKSDDNENGQARIASAPIVPGDAEVIAGMETIFLQPPAEKEERLEHFRYCMEWLRQNLMKRAVRPSPEPTVAGKGVAAINSGLDILAKGVSCTKLVVEIEE